VTFDPEVAPIYGVNIGLVDTLFALAMAATIVASINVVGVTLIAATLVIPSTSARLLTDSFGRMIVISTAIGAASGIVGMYVSYWLDVSSGATIVLLEAAVFLGCVIVTSLTRRRPAWVRQPIPVLARERPADDFE
jgi:manganese/iron transport system permease protein/iron/zinc/copper transport system permease protein